MHEYVKTLRVCCFLFAALPAHLFASAEGRDLQVEDLRQDAAL